MRRHWKIRVKGKVQGVFYRKFTKEKADQLQVTGWVRNEPDGSVYVEAEGNEGQLKEFAAWCRQGPPDAMVGEVNVEEGSVQYYPIFEIRRI